MPIPAGRAAAGPALIGPPGRRLIAGPGAKGRIAGPGAKGRIAGPGAAGRGPADGTFSARAAAGVTPSVLAVGVTGGCPTIGRAAVNCWGGIGRAMGAIGRDPTIADAGTVVAALRLMKLFTVTLLVMLVTCVTFTCCT